jgi:hypothetical protein
MDAITVEEARLLAFAMEMGRPTGDLVPICKDGGACIRPSQAIELGNGG